MARAFNALVASVAIFGLILQGALAVRQLGLVHGLWSLTGYFTEWANALVALVAGASVLAPSSWLAQPRVRMMALVGISMVGIVYSMALRALMPDDFGMLLAGSVQHDVVPLLFAAAWLFGPHGNPDRSWFLWILALPLVFLAAMVLRGLATGWYPYWFIDPGTVDMTGAALVVAAMVAAFLLLSLGALWVERRLAVSRE